MAVGEIMIMAVALGLAVAIFTVLGSRRLRRKAGHYHPDGWRASASIAAFPAGAMFAFVALYAVPWVMQQEPWRTFEALARLLLVIGAGFVLSMLMVRLLIKDTGL